MLFFFEYFNDNGLNAINVIALTTTNTITCTHHGIVTPGMSENNESTNETNAPAANQIDTNAGPMHSTITMTIIMPSQIAHIQFSNGILLFSCLYG